MDENTENGSSSSSELKHLGLIHTTLTQALSYVSDLYEQAKQKSGPLQSTVGAVEGAVTPVCGKLKGVHEDVLRFLDNKVDEAKNKFDEHAPPMAKQAVETTGVLFQGASDKALKIAGEHQKEGSKAALRLATTECKELLFTHSAKAWGKLNSFKPVNAVTDKAVPAAANLSEKYNGVVKEMSEKGYPLVGYFPLVPVDDIVKAFSMLPAEETEPSE